MPAAPHQPARSGRADSEMVKSSLTLAGRAEHAPIMPRRPRPALPRIVVTRRLPQSVETRMRELFDARFNPQDTPMSRADLHAAMQDCDVLVPTVTDDL